MVSNIIFWLTTVNVHESFRGYAVDCKGGGYCRCVELTCLHSTPSKKDQPNDKKKIILHVSRRRAKTSQTRSLLCDIMKPLSRLKNLMLRASCSPFCRMRISLISHLYPVSLFSFVHKCGVFGLLFLYRPWTTFHGTCSDPINFSLNLESGLWSLQKELAAGEQ